MRLQIFTPLFTGATPDRSVIARRYKYWIDWFKKRNHSRLKSLCPDGVFVQAYGPGTEIAIPDERSSGAIAITFPKEPSAQAPKGVVGRLHLVKTLAAAEHHKWDFAQTIFGCIDGSGAFDYDSLELLVEPFEDPDVAIVLGRRPADCCGMGPGRKALEEWEQFLLFVHRSEELKAAFKDYNLEAMRLPDGQAGCWAFRLTAASRLALTSASYLEYDVLACAVESGFKIAYTEPLRMSRQPRHSTASADPIGWSIGKIEFIERKLRITRRDIALAWRRFQHEFAGTEVAKRLPKNYETSLRLHCGTDWDARKSQS